MYALGSAATLATEAVVGISLAAAAMGVQFNATMESNSLAFEHFAGGAKQAKLLTQQLFNIARDTPFSFEDITTAARRFLAFGFSVKETIPLLRTLGDTLSFTGGSTDEILRMAKAFGDIRAKGRLMQQEMNQLANLGIPIRDILAKGGLELTKKQLLNVGRAGIPAERAITAIKKGLDKTFGGGAKKYLNTFNGQWQRFTDNLKAGAGKETQDTGLFDFLKSGLKSLNDYLEGDNMLTDGSLTKRINGIVGAISDGFTWAKGAVSTFMKTIAPAQPFFENVLWPLIKGIGQALMSTFMLGLGVVGAFAKVLGFLGKHAAPLKGIFQTIGYVIGFLFGGVILKVISYMGRLPGLFKIVGIAAGLVMTPFRIGAKVFEFFGGVILKVFSKIGGAIISKIPLLGTFVGGIRKMATGVQSILGGMVGWIFRRLGRLGPDLFHMGAKAARGFADGFKQVGKFMLGVFGAVGSGIANIGDSVRKWLNDNTPFGDKISLGFLGSVHIPALAMGGDITRGGVALVGEQGPEMVRLPTGSNVAPLRPATARKGRGGAGDPMAAEPGTFAAVKVAVHAPVYLDRRQVGQAMGEYVAERRARR